MRADDFIGLEPSESEHNEEENGLDTPKLNSDETNQQTSDSQPKEGIIDGENLVNFEDNDERQEEQQEVDMDLEDDPLPINHTPVNNSMIGESSITGVKRARTTNVDQESCVRVVYSSLTRESKRKLMELMKQWSQWHAQRSSSSSQMPEEALESGEETYYPALHVGAENTSAVSFWVENIERKEDVTNLPLDSCSIPFYDRGCTLELTSLDDSTSFDRIGSLEASRCFNCGSYSHALKECPKPRDNAAVNSARKNHSSKRNQTPGSSGPGRYYQKVQGKFDDLKAGVLGPETRECLGIGENDPPPWLHRMRQLGYPPGYLDEVEDEDKPSGIAIIGEEEPKAEYEDGEIPEIGEPVPPEKKMTVDFPGINAPIPDNADHRRWSHNQRNDVPSSTDYGSSHRSSDHYREHNGSVSSYSLADLSRDRYSSHHERSIVPPGTEGSSSLYSSRYGGAYDHNKIPSLGRSLSDRSWPTDHSPHQGGRERHEEQHHNRRR